MSDTICTVTGNYFDFEYPERSTFNINDIAHALAHICRFTGHTREFYSVAQHSILVSDQLPKELQLAGLLHDAAEAFIGDVSSPLKRMLPDYKAVERRVEHAIFNRFGVRREMYENKAQIKAADLTLLATERRDLMPDMGDQWEMLKGVQPLPTRIRAWSSAQSKVLFVRRYHALVDSRRSTVQ